MSIPRTRAGLPLAGMLLCLALTGAMCESGVEPNGGDPQVDSSFADALGVAPTAADPVFEATAGEVLADLNSTDALLQTLLSGGWDEDSAKEEVASVLTGDPLVSSVTVDSGGLWIEYADGILATIILDPEDMLPEADPNEVVAGARVVAGAPSKDVAARVLRTATDLIGSTKTVFYCPHYYEEDRSTLADSVISAANAKFADCKLDPFTVYKGAECSLARLIKLNDYGVVHLYSHGRPWPSKTDAQRVYVMTGELATPRKVALLRAAGLIPTDVVVGVTVFGTPQTRQSVLLISSNFFSKFNNFEQSRSLVYLGFCFSWYGGWPDAVTNTSKAMAVLGYDWAVSTYKNASLGRSMYNTMGNTSYSEPAGLEFWYTFEDTQYNTIDTDSAGELIFPQVQLRWQGNGNTVLWEKAEPQQDTRVDQLFEALHASGLRASIYSVPRFVSNLDGSDVQYPDCACSWTGSGFGCYMFYCRATADEVDWNGRFLSVNLDETSEPYTGVTRKRTVVITGEVSEAADRLVRLDATETIKDTFADGSTRLDYSQTFALKDVELDKLTGLSYFLGSTDETPSLPTSYEIAGDAIGAKAQLATEDMSLSCVFASWDPSDYDYADSAWPENANAVITFSP